MGPEVVEEVLLVDVEVEVVEEGFVDDVLKLVDLVDDVLELVEVFVDDTLVELVTVPAKHWLYPIEMSQIRGGFSDS